MTSVVGLYNYWVVIFLMMTGFFMVIARANLIQKVIGLNIFQISVFLLYITMGKIRRGHRTDHSGRTPRRTRRIPIRLPSVLMLTAIVVGVATTSLALALIVRIREAYGTIEDDEILAKDKQP